MQVSLGEIEDRAMWNIDDSGIDRDALRRYIEDQVYSLPGVESPEDSFTILLTGSRATGTHKPGSDVDIDVLCPQTVYESVHEASLKAGIIDSPVGFFRKVPYELRHSYFDGDCEDPHFSLTSLGNIQRRFDEYDDVALWIWTNARIIADPDGRFQRILDGFRGYPQDVLVRKIKYRWLLSGYWAVDGYPGTHDCDDEFVAAAASVLNSINDWLRVFLLVERRPFPYMEKLMPVARTTRLGAEFCPLLQRSARLAVGAIETHLDPWERLDLAISPMRHQNPGTEGEHLSLTCEQAMIEAGVDADWVKADYDNVDELLLGGLGPPP